MKLLYQARGWLFIRPIRWFTFGAMRASCGLRLLPEKNEHHKYYGPRYYMPNVHWWILYKTFGKFSLWLSYRAWRIFCDWTGGWRQSYPLIARVIHKTGITLSYPYNGGECYHCASSYGDPIDLTEDETFELIDSGTSSTPEGVDHWFRGITTCPKCGYKQEYGDGSL